MTRRASRRRLGASHARHVAALLIAGMFMLPAARAGAQRTTTTLEVGGAHVRYADTVNTTAAIVAPAVRVVAGRGSLDASGMFSQSPSAGWTTQGTLGAAATFPLRGALSAEAVGTAGGSTRRDGLRTGQATAMLRAYLSRRAAGVWFGGGGGGAWDGLVHRSVAQGEAGAWVSGDHAAATVSVIPTRIDDSLTYADAQLALSWVASVLRLDARAGVRAGGGSVSLDSAARRWGSVDATVQLRDRVAIVASAGTYPVDLTQGYPGGRYATLGVRLALTRPWHAAGAKGDTRADMQTDTARRRTVSDLALQSSTTTGHTTLRVYAPRAGTVAVAGDFTNWHPVACVPDGKGWWSVTLAIPRGAHQMNVRLDNDAWRVPPGLTPVTDEFGGTVGVLDVP